MIETPQNLPPINLSSIRLTVQPPLSHDHQPFLNFHRQPFGFVKSGDSFDLGGHLYV